MTVKQTTLEEPTTEPTIEPKEEIKPQEQTAAVATIDKANPIIGQSGIELKTWSDLYRFSALVIKAGMAPSGVRNTEQAFLLIQYGMELGMSPMTAIQNMFIVGNRPALYGPIGIGLAKATGKCSVFDPTITTGTYPNDDYTAICEIQRKGEPNPIRYEFSIADAKRGELWGTNNWKKFPKDMLRWKAVWRALNHTFPDVLKGVAPAEFAEEFVEATKVEVLPPKPEQTRSESLADKLEQKKAAEQSTTA